MNSLRRRLRRLLLVLVGGMLAQWLVADRMLVYVGEHEMQTRLQHDTDSLASSLHARDDGSLQVDPRAPGTIYERTYSGHYYVIDAGAQQLRSPSFGDEQPFRSPQRVPSLDYLRGPAGQPLLVLSSAIDVAGRHAIIAVGEDLTDIRRELLEFRLVFLGSSLAVLAAAMALQGHELRWALRPLDTVRDAVLRMSAGGAPVPEVEAPIEVRPLVAEITRLLAFVDQRLQLSRTAIGNLSHALKTPLAAIFRLLEDPRMQAPPGIRRQLEEQADAIHQRIERELKRARLAGGESAGGRFDPRAELPALVLLLQRIYHDKPIEIEWSAPQRTIAADREDLMELIGNLADNACKWATSKAQIVVRANGGLDILVADDGPGCSDAVLQRLGRRGEREDESIPGHGFGLAIVRDIVDAAGGTLAFARSRLGGLEVTAHLPLRGPLLPA